MRFRYTVLLVVLLTVALSFANGQEIKTGNWYLPQTGMDDAHDRGLKAFVKASISIRHVNDRFIAAVDIHVEVRDPDSNNVYLDNAYSATQSEVSWVAEYQDYLVDVEVYHKLDDRSSDTVITFRYRSDGSLRLLHPVHSSGFNELDIVVPQH